jgi:hypothetical protein
MFKRWRKKYGKGEKIGRSDAQGDARARDKESELVLHGLEEPSTRIKE